MTVKTNQEMRLDYCEYCGAATGAYETHHIRSKGAGGDDQAVNKINLCIPCHNQAQEYKIPREELIQITADREGFDFLDAAAAIAVVPSYTPEEKEEKKEAATLDECINLLIQTKEREQDCIWVRAKLAKEVVDRGAKKSWIASQTGFSSAYITTLDRTIRAFPNGNVYSPELFFAHFKIASATTDPVGWIEKAVKENLSTRQLRAEINKESSEADVDDTDKVQKDAERAYTLVLSVIEKGGEPTKWLKEKLKEVLQ